MWPALIGAAATGIGGLLNHFSSNNARDQAAEQYNQQIAQQREFATTGLQWRAGDAMKAYEATGIHPLAMLGVQGPSYTPVNMVGSANTSLGDAVSSAGQGITRAMLAAQSEDKRMEHMTKLANINVEGAELDNAYKRLRIQSEALRLRQQLTPGVPNVGQSEAKTMFPGVEPKIIDDVTVTRTPRGGYVTLPSEAAQQRMSEMFGLSTEWFSRNRAWLATPEAREWVKKYLPPPPYGMQWRYHVPTGEWLPSGGDYPDRHFTNPQSGRNARRMQELGL